MAQNEAKDAPKRPQEAPRRTKEAIPNGKTKKGPNQDDSKTVLDRPRADWHGSAAPPASQTTPKSTPKRKKIDAENQEPNKAIQDDLGPVWD